MSDIPTKKCYPEKKGSKYYLSGYHKPESFLFGTLPSFIHSIFNRKSTIFHEHGHLSGNPEPRSDKLAIYWIGHASFLVQIGGFNLLLDPVFGSPSLFFQRKIKPGIAYDSLPPIDMVLYSHNHPDHFELKTVRNLARDHASLFYVPEGDGRLLGSIPHKESTWWESHLINDRLRLTFLPAAHWSCSGLFDANASLWGSWMIECDGSTIYFGGDTAYFSHFASIGAHFEKIDIALLPIAPEHPRDWMKRTHMNAHDAIKAFADLNARHLVPMHWGTFQFGVDALHEPIVSLETAWREAQFGDEKVLRVLKVGEGWGA